MVQQGFHYTNLENWRRLRRPRNIKRELSPGRRLVAIPCIIDQEIPELPEWAHDGYVFAFPDLPAPKPWMEYQHGEDEWDELTAKLGDEMVLVNFELLETDQAFVVDRAHIADFQWRHTSDKKEALRKYALSRVPAHEYDDSFRMPELIVNNPIALERLVVCTGIERRVVKRGEEWAVEYIEKPVTSLQQSI